MAESRKPPELDGALILDADGDLDEDELPAPRELPLDHDPREDGKADLALEMLTEILKRDAARLFYDKTPGAHLS